MEKFFQDRKKNQVAIMINKINKYPSNTIRLNKSKQRFKL